MPLRLHNAIPPGGYVYEQRGLDGAVIKRFSTTTMPFAQFAREIQKMRVANNLPNSTMQETMKEVDEAQCERLNFNPEWCLKKKGGFSPSRLFKTASAAVRLAASKFRPLENLSAIKNGTQTLLDWNDDGFVPVDAATAQARSDVCTGRISGNPCPFNERKTIDFTSPAAAAIKSYIEKKHKMNLAVDGETELHVCMICLCHLPLKVWTPLDTLLGRMDAAMLDKFKTQMPSCWILNEKPQTPAL